MARMQIRGIWGLGFRVVGSYCQYSGSTKRTLRLGIIEVSLVVQHISPSDRNPCPILMWDILTVTLRRVPKRGSLLVGCPCIKICKIPHRSI